MDVYIRYSVKGYFYEISRLAASESVSQRRSLFVIDFTPWDMI